MKEAVNSSSIVEKLQPKRLEVCHGKTVFQPAAHLAEYINKTEKKLFQNNG
jgi:hypothetical protein